MYVLIYMYQLFFKPWLDIVYMTKVYGYDRKG